MTARSRTSPAAIAKAEREARAVELRLQGTGYRAIATELGIAQSTAYRIVRKVLDNTPTERRRELRELEAQRLDLLWAAGLEKLHGDDKARIIRALTGVSNRRAKLLGLDATPTPENSGVSVIAVNTAMLPPEMSINEAITAGMSVALTDITPPNEDADD